MLRTLRRLTPHHAVQSPTLSRHLSSQPTRTRTRTPLETQFETWIHKLKPGFTPSDVNQAILAQPDPDLALDIFRWTAQTRNYKHTHLTYLTMIETLTTGKRYSHAQTLIEEVLAGACEPSLPLYNSIIQFCCGRKFLFNRAFDVYNAMLRTENCKPNLDTYTMLFTNLLRRFNKLHVCYVYMHSVRSMTRQMKAGGIIPDRHILNLIIKAHAKVMEVDEAVRVFREMGLYGCEPNEFSYSYVIKGLCEKGRVGFAVGFFKEMREKGLVPKSSVYMVLVCSLALEKRFGEAVEVVYDLLYNGMGPDYLTYKTLLEELCRDGKGDKGFELLEEFKKRDRFMNERTHKALLNELHFLSRD